MTTYSYLWRPGDTPEAVAALLGTDTDSLKKANPGRAFRSGETYLVPTDGRFRALYELLRPSGSTVRFARHRVKKGDTLPRLSAEYGSTVHALRAVNPDLKSDRDLPVGTLLTVPLAPVGARCYTVRPGDTLQGIAQKENTSLTELMSLNFLTSRAVLYPGTVLWLPR